MPSDHELHRLSKAQKVKYYSKYCVLVLICCLSIIIIPGIYLVSVLNEKSARSKEFGEGNYQGTAGADHLSWYFAGGKQYPTAGGKLESCWPGDGSSDRIKTQLMYMPPEATLNTTYKIVHFGKFPVFHLKSGLEPFKNCPVKACSISTNRDEAETADVLLFTDDQSVPPTLRTLRLPRQVWIMYLSKSPYHTNSLERYAGLINWTASYRTDSDIVVPYSKWIYYNESVKELPIGSKNFASTKTKKIVWFVRDCKIDNNGRQKYVEELQKYVEIDIFGNCQDHLCPCTLPEECVRLLNEYKFYLAFEAFNCRDYITEKLYLTLQHNVLPLVMGARSEDYKRLMPVHSYIDVGHFSSPRTLAEYLHKLDKNDTLYNEYFRWKNTGEMIDSRFDCRLCALLHSSCSNKNYPDVDLWWRKGACTESSWNHTERV